MKYEIIATGSKGNAVLINDILVDCGIPFKKLKPYLYDVNTLLITHEHSDHVKATTLRAIKKHFPNIQVVANYMVKQLFPNYVDLTANGGVPLFTQSGIVTPFDCVHDVPCLGYSWIVDGKKVVYATDTSTMENCPVDIAVDYCFLEANYDEIKVQQIVQNTDMLKKYGYDIRKGTVRHFSKQQCKSFFYKNRADENSVLVQLHQSARFY